MSAPLLSVSGLTVAFKTARGQVHALNGVDLHLERGEVLGIVGESGSGKSATGLALLRMLPSPQACMVEGEILLNGQNLVALTEDAMTKVRGRRIALIPQEPMTSLNPVMTIGYQLAEPLRHHFGLPRRAALAEAAQWLKQVGVSDPVHRLRQYPHQLSGGMRQRACIAMALACRPEILIADEPTTALDVTIQAQILGLLRRLQAELELSMLFISHDFGVIAAMSHRIAVMYAGRIVETGPTREVLRHPLHPYTRALIRSIPRAQAADGRSARLHAIPGIVPSLYELPAGCAFADRCEEADQRCREQTPFEVEADVAKFVRCWRHVR
jgi:oligopeptide/dipeptide ABC transporter ATP-binding protein